MRRVRVLSAICVLIMVVAGCSSQTQPNAGVAEPGPPSNTTTSPRDPVDGPPPRTGADPQQQQPSIGVPTLVRVNYGEEGQEQGILLLPNPAKLQAIVTGTRKVQWRVTNQNSEELRRLIPIEVAPGEWVVEWGNPNPPPRSPVYLSLYLEVPDTVPDMPGVEKEQNSRWLRVTQTLVRSAW